MLASQILLTVIILFIFVKTLKNFFKKEEDKKFYFVWLVFWLIMLILINFTQILSFLAKKLGVGRGVDLAIYISIILIYYLIYFFFVKLRKIEKKITKITQKIALSSKTKTE